MASLAIGIVGLPNVGKSTLFNALTKKSVLAANYPFATIDPSVGVVAVPDARLDKLVAFSQSKKRVPAIVEFVDIAGLVKGASEGQGLGNKFLSHIRETDAIAQVVRIFEDPNIIHVDNKISPIDDVGVIMLELILADLQTVTTRRSTLGKLLKQGDKEAKALDGALTRIEAELLASRPASKVALTDEEKPLVKQLQLLTMKPMMFVLNKKAGGVNLDETNDPRYTALLDFFKSEGATYVLVDARIEEELKEMEGEERETFRSELGAGDDGINNLIKAGYRMLGLMTYLTTGEEESRAWTVKIGSTAPQAGAAIHGDFEEKFIRAEVIGCDQLLAAGSYTAAREKGLVRTEGKEYVVKDGDVIEFKI